MSSYEAILLEIEGEAATIQFNRPEKKNALSPTLHENMNDALEEVARARCKLLVVTGAGDAFCGGMDLEKCFLEPYDDPPRMAKINESVFSWMKRLKKFPAVTLARVNGFCFGAGMEIAGICDLCIAADESEWGLSEVNFGIFPGGGTTWAYAHNMPSRKQALYYALTGEPFDGKTAAELGWATRSVPRSELDSVVAGIAKSITAKGRGVLAKTKEVYERSIFMDFETSIDYETAKQMELSRETGDDWIRTALTSFRKREFKPGHEAYKLTRDV